MKSQLKVERAKKDIAQTALANALEVSQQTISSIEKGKFVPATL